MKNLIIASAVALASFVTFSAPSEAAMMMHKHCVVKTVKHRVHGHWVVSKEKVCR